jgi:MFS family permease
LLNNLVIKNNVKWRNIPMSKEKTPPNNDDSIRDRTRSQIVINSANIVNNADSQLFPTVLNQISTSTGIGLQSLGFIISVRTFLQSFTTPLWGWWSDRHSRRNVLAIGCFIWALCTILLGLSVNEIDMLIYRAITGIGLAVIVPTTNSLIVDLYPPSRRGKAFGWLGLTGTIGALVGTVFALVIVQFYDKIFGMDSWRFIFFVWGSLSLLIGMAILIFAKDPPRGQMDSEQPNSSETNQNDQPIVYQMRIKDFKKIFTKKSFLIIVAQGIAGTIPWNGIMLMITWLEYVGFDPIIAGLMFIIIGVGAAGGNLFGGWLGDKASKWSPDRGRILVAQISVFAGIPMTLILFFVIPMSTTSLGWYLLVGAITGFMITWTTYSTNNPLFAELFEPEIRGSVFAVDAMLEGGFAAFAPSIVTIISIQHGFVDPGMMDISALPAAWRLINMQALAQGMFWTAFVPWIICLLFYTLLYFTYPKDRDTIKKQLQDRNRISQNI